MMYYVRVPYGSDHDLRLQIYPFVIQVSPQIWIDRHCAMPFRVQWGFSTSTLLETSCNTPLTGGIRVLHGQWSITVIYVEGFSIKRHNSQIRQAKDEMDLALRADVRKWHGKHIGHIQAYLSVNYVLTHWGRDKMTAIPRMIPVFYWSLYTPKFMPTCCQMDP